MGGWSPAEDKMATTRRSIVAVCRMWKEIGMEFQHEFINIPTWRGGEERIDGLIRLFKASMTASSQGHGWWTKRINCNIEVLSRTQYVEKLFELLELCHNLGSFTVIGRADIALSIRTRLAHTLQTRFSHSLRRFECAPTGNALGDLVLPALPLRSLTILACGSYLDKPDCPSFNTITTLSLHAPYSFESNLSHPRLYFPRLRTLAVLYPKTTGILLLQSFFERHNRTLKNLYLLTGNFIKDLPEIFRGGTGIQWLTLNWQDLYHLVRAVEEGLIPLVGIQRLGIVRAKQEDVEKVLRPAIMRVIERKALPDLVVLRFMCLISPVRFQTNRWRVIIQKCLENQVKLEDSRGRAVEVWGGDTQR